MISNKCRHFNGTKEDRCLAKVKYSDVINGRDIPCIKKYCKSTSCASYSEPTAEDIAREEADIQIFVNQMKQVGPLVKKIKDENKKKNASGIVDCPICKGKIGFTHAAINGHVWMKCQTDGCISFME